MYRIDRDNNNIEKLEERLFGDLRIRERDHLQEWIAHNPEVLGEDLLIIQKEFDGFNDTQERLDLLALDKSGGLVIIENKLDDSGRDVVWQALKYASYCSTLTTEQVIDVFQKYLDRNGIRGKAQEVLEEFLEVDGEDLSINYQDQRIMFVANNYRKEVTSTVLWLLNHDIQVQCFKATPYSFGAELYLTVDQIIPLPETSEFMIDAQQKQKEVKKQTKAATERNAKLIQFWSGLKEHLKQTQFNILEQVSPKPLTYMGTWNGKGFFAFCIGRHGLRVELYFNDDMGERLIGYLYQRKEEIEEAFGKPLTWELREGKKASRVKSEIPYSFFNLKGSNKVHQQEDFAQFYNWYGDEMPKLHKVLLPHLDKVNKL